MIDEKKIENVARVCGSHFIGDNEDAAAQYGFKAGARWALQEFKKSLWHDASEEPEIEELILVHNEEDDAYKVFIWFCIWGSWDYFRGSQHLDKWCRISDLLPAKGGEQC